LTFLNLSGPLSEVVLLNKENENNFTLRILPEVLFSVPIAMYFPKNHFLDNLIDQKINVLNSAGLVDYLIAKYAPKPVELETMSGPKRLTFDQLAGGIYVCLAGSLMSFLAFVVEVLMKKCQ
jgi:hypothetical protein